ncbi:MAG: M48 family metalloprotease [Rhodoferax sp.]|nr:M48 family metalloprotease [Rhodoferax sp.]
MLGQASYSREAEQEADADAVRVLKAAGISPAVMVTLFEKLEEKRRKSDKRGDATAGQASWVGIAFASHPSDADRVHFFKEAAGH